MFFYGMVHYLKNKENFLDSTYNTLESGIDLGQGINAGPGKFGKKNKRRP